jgi:hypothetical protein
MPVGLIVRIWGAGELLHRYTKQPIQRHLSDYPFQVNDAFKEEPAGHSF